MSKNKKVKEVIYTSVIAVVFTITVLWIGSAIEDLIDNCGGAGGVIVKVGSAIESAGENLR